MLLHWPSVEWILTQLGTASQPTDDEDFSCAQVVRSKKVRALHCYSKHKYSLIYHNMNMQQKKWKSYFGALNSTAHVGRLGVMFLFYFSYIYVCKTHCCQKVEIWLIHYYRQADESSCRITESQNSRGWKGRAEK